MEASIELGVSEFVALLNQTLEFAYPGVIITGELANLRVSKNRWVYFDLKDDNSSVKFFGTVYQLPGPLEDGMILKVRGQPKLHSLYGFSVTVQSMQPVGEGSIRKAADLLKAKLETEGLFDESRKRGLPHPPRTIGLITSRQSAAYADFMKILAARWQGIDIHLIDVQVQGEPAPGQIVAAIEQFNALAEPPEVLVVIRGGGSAEDLAAFSTEQVTRAVAASRVPTLVAIGHEIDVSLAELAADRRASTPSNAAELLVPDRAHSIAQLSQQADRLRQLVELQTKLAVTDLQEKTINLTALMQQRFDYERQLLLRRQQLLGVLSPTAILRRGYAIVRSEGRVVRSAAKLKPDTIIDVQVSQGSLRARVTKTKE